MERDGRPTFEIVMSENHFGTKLKIGYNTKTIDVVLFKLI